MIVIYNTSYMFQMTGMPCTSHFLLLALVGTWWNKNILERLKRLVFLYICVYHILLKGCVPMLGQVNG